MNAIIRYIINMLPYMLISIPVYLIGRALFIRSKHIKINWQRETLLFLFVVFAVGLASQTIIPKFEFGVNGFNIVQNGVHKTNLIPFKVLAETYREVFINGYINYFIINFLGNIVLFIPFGLCIPLLWKTSTRKTAFLGFCSSLFIELCQLFLARGTDVDDLILNTSGVMLGLLIYKILKKYCGKLIEKFD